MAGEKIVYLVGAGVSQRAPSRLPDGTALAKLAFDLLSKSGAVLLNPGELSRLRRRATRLRLEILLERLSNELSSRFLFQIFQTLRFAVPNLNHLALIESRPYAIVTTNQDLLLEKASERLGHHVDTLHLHGRCDDLRTIVTTISQYLGGLRPSVSRKLAHVLDESHLVVMGYSGRDEDVMEKIASSNCKSVVWIKHPGASESVEVKRLRSQMPDRLAFVTMDAHEWLQNQTSPETFRTLLAIEREFEDKSETSRIGTEPSLQNPAEINLAFGRVLEHLCHFNDAISLYRRVRELRLTPDMNRRVQFAIARAEMFLYRFDEAYRIYQRLISNARSSAIERCTALNDVVFILRNRSDYRRARKQLSRLEGLLAVTPESTQKDNLMGSALSARAGFLRLDGSVTGALALYRKAGTHYRRARNIDGRIDCATWTADCLLTMGRYDQSMDMLQRAHDDSDAYGRAFGRPWPMFLKGELMGLQGAVGDGISLMKEARRLFRRVRNPQGEAYTLIYMADLYREISLTDASRTLILAGKILKEHSFVYAYGRLLLEEAELARARGHYSRMHDFLGQTKEHLHNARLFPTRPDLLEAHTHLIKAEYLRGIGKCDLAAHELSPAMAIYKDLKCRWCITRVQISQWLLSRSKTPPIRLVDKCRNLGYYLELERLTGADADSYYPIHLV